MLRHTLFDSQQGIGSNAHCQISCNTKIIVDPCCYMDVLSDHCCHGDVDSHPC